MAYGLHRDQSPNSASYLDDRQIAAGRCNKDFWYHGVKIQLTTQLLGSPESRMEGLLIVSGV